MVFFNRRRNSSTIRRLEYIQSSGTQYINTGYKPSNNTRLLLEFQAMQIDTAAWKGIAVARNSPEQQYNDSFSFWISQTNRYRSDFGAEVSDMTVAADTNKHLLDKNQNTTYLDNTIMETSSAAVFSCNYDLYFFAGNTAGVLEYFTNMRLYSARIYDNGTLIRDYAPCYDESDVACLYDRVNRQYVYNAGTGSFIAGPEI